MSVLDLPQLPRWTYSRHRRLYFWSSTNRKRSFHQKKCISPSLPCQRRESFRLHKRENCELWSRRIWGLNAISDTWTLKKDL